MKFFYSLIFLLIIVAVPRSFAQQPVNKPGQPPAKQQPATQPVKPQLGTQAKPAATTPTTSSSSRQTTAVPPGQKPNQATTTQTGKPANTNNTGNKPTTVTNTTPSSAKPAPGAKAATTVASKEEQSVDLAIIGDTVGMVLHADPRLAMITYNTRHDGQVVNGRKTGSIYSARGFRVQIYSGSDRAVATQRKIDFIRRYPGVRTYMTYIAPTFRVKVGDYRDRKSAQNMYQQVSKLYNPCMIVNDIIEVNTFRND